MSDSCFAASRRSLRLENIDIQGVAAAARCLDFRSKMGGNHGSEVEMRDGRVKGMGF